VLVVCSDLAADPRQSFVREVHITPAKAKEPPPRLQPARPAPERTDLPIQDQTSPRDAAAELDQLERVVLDLLLEAAPPGLVSEAEVAQVAQQTDPKVQLRVT
jgi:hypothetical protein